MTTKIIGGTIADITGTPLPDAKVEITLTTILAFRIVDDTSIVPKLTLVIEPADLGVWTATVECNDTITPAGTLYHIKETYPRGGWKDYYVQVLSTLGGGTNQVRDLIVPELSPVGILNEFLTKVLADTLYEPIGGGAGGGPVEVMDGVNNAIELTVFDLPNSNPAAVAIVDANGDQLVSFGGGGSGTEYTEDGVSVADPVGGMLMARRRDVLVSEVSASGDNIALNATAQGQLRVKLDDAITVNLGLTDAQLRATPVPVSGTVSVTEPVSVDDNGASLTVDAPTGTPVNVQVGDGTRTATVRDTGASDSLNVAIVDAAGAHITSFGGGVQYTEGDTDATITGTALVFEGAGNALVAATGDVTNGLDVDVTRVQGTVAVSGPLTDAQLRATPVPVSGTVTVNVGLTDAQLRATAVPVSLASVPSHAVTNAGTFAVQADTELPTAAALADNVANPTVPGVGAFGMVFDGATWDRGTQPVTDTQLRATPVPVSGTITVNVGLTDAQLRATAVPVSLASVPSHAVTNAGTFAVQADTELPAAAALADGVANPTTPTVGAASLIYNGTTWDRMRGDGTNGLDVDVTRVSPGTGAFNLGKAEDDPHASGDVGVMALGVRNDAGTAFGANADYVPLSIDAAGALRVTGGGGGTQYVEDIASAADPTGNAVMLVRRDTPGAIVTTDGDNVAQRGTNFGAAYAQIVTSAGAFVDTFGGGTQYTEDVAAAADPVGGAQILVRADTPAALVTTNGDNVARRGTNFGAAYSQIVTSAGAFVDSFGGGTEFAEDAAHVTGALGKLNLAVRRTIPSSGAGADEDYAVLTVDEDGLLWVRSGVEQVRTDRFDLVTQAAAFAVNDQLCDEIELTNMSLVAGAGGRIVNAVLLAFNTTQIAAELWLYAANPTPAGTNAVHNQTDANQAASMPFAVIEFNTWLTQTDNIMSIGTLKGNALGGSPIYYDCADGTATQSVWGVLVTRTVVTPGATTDYDLILSRIMGA